MFFPPRFSYFVCFFAFFHVKVPKTAGFCGDLPSQSTQNPSLKAGSWLKEGEVTADEKVKVDDLDCQFLRKKLQEKTEENPQIFLVIESKIRDFLGFLEFFL